jgi:2-polyprenyl-3-methyl-5-hydroxy-6-metoxy-1,4-benzoquinol methylase
VAAATTTPGSALAFALGFAVGLYRLARWRLFVGDFLREVHRVEEMKVLDQILSQLSREKAARNSSKSTATEASDSAGLADEANLAVLDFGGGKGKTSAHMARHPAVDSVRAIDIDAHPPHVEKYDGRTIPFADGRFDLAVCLYVFHHIPHTRDLVQQLARKAKHVLIFEDLPEQSSSPLVARLTFGGHFLLFDQSVHTHLHHSTEEWRRLLADEWGSLSVLREFRIPPTAALPYERVALYCEAK